MNTNATHLTGANGSSTVMGAIRRASVATGVDFDYLVRTAQRESSLNPNARAPTSSAAGLFQFIDQTWLATLKSHGGKHGYGNYASQITQGANGRYFVADPKTRQTVMNLKFNPEANALMGAELTKGHGAYLKGRIGRDATGGELYVAHFLGPAGAADLIRAKESRPTASAAALFPAAARANPSIFYQNGTALTVASVYGRLTHGANQPVEMIAEPETQGSDSPYLQASLNDLSQQQMLMKLLLGDDTMGLGGGTSGTLLNTQLLSAFGPEQET